MLQKQTYLGNKEAIVPCLLFHHQKHCLDSTIVCNVEEGSLGSLVLRQVFKNGVNICVIYWCEFSGRDSGKEMDPVILAAFCACVDMQA